MYINSPNKNSTFSEDDMEIYFSIKKERKIRNSATS